MTFTITSVHVHHEERERETYTGRKERDGERVTNIVIVCHKFKVNDKH